MGKQTKYAGTQTEKNLEAAFAGETNILILLLSQRNRASNRSRLYS